MNAPQRIPSRRARRLLTAGLIGVLIAAPLAACGESEEQSTCSVYAEFLVAREKIRAVIAGDPSTLDSIDAVEDYLSVIQRLRETDSRHSQAIDELEVAVQDGLRTLESFDDADDDAQYSTWAPLVADDLEQAAKTADRVVELLTPDCVPDLES